MKTASAMIAELSALRNEMASVSDTEQDALMHRLWVYMAETYDMEFSKAVKRQPDFTGLCAYFSHQWNNYFSSKESKHSAAIIAGDKEPAITMSAQKHLANYHTELDELKLVDVDTGHGDFINVGCGPFPESLMRAYLKFDFPRFVGLDHDEGSVRLARDVFPRCVSLQPSKQIEFSAQEASQYDYSKARVIFLVNAVKHKNAILQQIATTMQDEALIIARNPPRLGRLIYEDMFEGQAASLFTVTGTIEKNALVTVYALRKRI